MIHRHAVWLVLIVATALAVASVGASAAPGLTVTDATVAEATVLEDTAVTVTATVENTDTTATTADIALTADGTVIETRSVTVAAGATATVTFTHVFEDPGTYAVAVDGVDAGTVTVTEDPALIEACTTITEPGTYRLDTDLTAAGDVPACIVIAASDVVLDGQGHVLDGTDGYTSAAETVHYGVQVTAPDDTILTNVTVRDLVVTEWTHGIDFDGVTDSTVVDVTAVHNRVGIAVRGGDDVTVRGVEVHDNAMHGVRIRGHSTGVTVLDSSITDNGRRGVFVSMSDATVVRGTHLSGNEAGVFVQDAQDTVITDNTIRDSTAMGVLLRTTNGSTVSGNTITGADVGIRMQAAHGVGGGHDDESGHEDDGGCGTADLVPGSTRIAGNTIADVTGHGIAIVGTGNEILVDNAVRNASGWAVYATDDATDITVEALRIDDRVTVAYTGCDVAVRAVPTPGSVPAGYTSLGVALEAMATTGTGGWTDVHIGYTDAALADAGISDAQLHLWQYRGDTWSPVGAPSHWRYAGGDWTATRYGHGHDPTTNTFTADSLDFGVYTPVAGAVTIAEISVTDASATPRSVDDGDRVTVTATVTYTGDTATRAVLDLVVDGEIRDSTVVTLGADARTTVSFTPVLDPGTHTLRVSGVDAGTVDVRDITAPTPRIAAPSTVGVGDAVTLSGAASTDDVRITTYTWTFPDGSTYHGPAAAFVADVPGTYPVSLTVADADGNTATATTVLRVADTTPPTADAGVDTVLEAGTATVLDGAGSADNVGITAYTWTLPDGTTLAGDTATISFDAPGTYTVTLTVTDAAGNSDTDTLSVLVTADETPPTPAIEAPTTATVGESVTLSATATDNVGVTDYTWTLPDGTTLAGDTATISFDTAGTYTVVLEVADAAGNTATTALTVTVEAATTAPPTTEAPDTDDLVPEEPDTGVDPVGLAIIVVALVIAVGLVFLHRSRR